MATREGKVDESREGKVTPGQGIVNNPRYHCPISGCQEVRLSKDFLNHFLKHSSEDISKLIGVSKLRLGARGIMISLNSKVNGRPQQLGCCFGCKKVFKKMILQARHSRECPCKTEQSKICNGILEQKKEVEPEVISEPVFKDIMAIMVKEVPEAEFFLKMNFPEAYGTCLKN
jgi:hypothetical protein